MAEDEKIQTKLFEWLSYTCGRPVDEIKPESFLVKELRIGGDDAIELIDELINEFNLDLKIFDEYSHFPTEAE